MEFLSGFLTVTAVAVLGVIAPGPDTAVIAKNSLIKSREDGIATTLGVVLGNVIYVSLALAGLGAVITSSASLFAIVKLCGALYLLLLGANLLFSKRTEVVPSTSGHSHAAFVTSFREGLFTNLSNPKFMIFLLALFTQVIDPATPFLTQVLYVYQIPVIAFLWFSALTVGLTMPVVKSRVSGFMHHVERVTGLALIALGAKVALSGND
jgi:RhtB (resistance to homoserine/threonine) family protein